MSSLDLSAPESLPAESSQTSSECASAGHPDSNGHPDAQGPTGQTITTNIEPVNNSAPSHSAVTGERSHVDRADELLDRITERVACFTARWGQGILRMFARIREEAEDIWGEAQSIRRGDQP